jgi:hypothetical protein
MQLVQTVTLTSTASTLSLTSIPQDATDLLLVFGTRTDSSGNRNCRVKINGTSANYSQRLLEGTGGGAGSSSSTRGDFLWRGSTSPSETANTFSNVELYIPNYRLSAAKSVSINSVTEANATNAYQVILAGLWNDTSAITSIEMRSLAASVVAGTTATLYKSTKS